ncbi:hypothetical protein [Pseudonocardia acidicola]|uniref:Capsular polysaccharide biosynthesis protein n=1 Tax=Pseudonocardia acidicola TaxID=2724939 RepID=A0ABX1S4Y0_9PSEU|nr:hypothetical protein [Pseudonocardia acidicola]NMH96651.1 hypothetical protein [Pseudonocardia acidicola]
MDVNEILLRVFRGHWRLLLVCLLLPPLVLGLLAAVTPRTYASWSRIQGGTVLAGSDTEADALLNLVKGVATSNAMVQRALGEAGVTGRDPTTTATRIDVVRLGSSAVFDVSVTDRDPAVATKLDQALATDVVSYLNNAGDARTANLLSGLSDRQKQLQDQRQKTATALALTKDPVASADTAAQLAGIDQQLNDLSSTMRQLQLSGTSAGSAGSAAVISPAVSTGATPTNLATDLGLALVIGLVAGLLAATVVEVLRPRVPDARAFARGIGVPLIGQLPRTDQGRAADPELLFALRRAAQRHEVRRALLVGPGDPQRLAAIAAALRAALNEADPPAGGPGMTPPPSPAPRPAGTNGLHEAGPARTDVRTAVLEAPWEVTRGRTFDRLDVQALTTCDTLRSTDHCGLLPVVPVLARHTALQRLDDLAAATGLPVIGVLGDPGAARRPRSWRRLLRRSS